jgi:glutamate 5-kinase
LNSIIAADLVLFLTDVPGVFSKPPTTTGETLPIRSMLSSEISNIDTNSGQNDTGSGYGGMQSKLEAAKLIASKQTPSIIMRGSVPRPVKALVEGCMNTTILPSIK